ncbi:MAG: topoisomerase C-terminal repeat-containing protein [Clostridia bacterium]|nr:topoisomerase C-terminal repeat-containing protein [Clostridia bacterium]
MYKGILTVKESVELAEKEIAEVFAKNPNKIPAKRTEQVERKVGEIVGNCPVCGEHVICGRQSFGCMGFSRGCEFRVPFELCRRPLLSKEVQGLLHYKKTNKLYGFYSRAGKPFSASLLIKDGQVIFDFQLKNDEKPTENTEKPKVKKKTKTKKSENEKDFQK